VHTTSDASLGQDLHIHAGGALTLQSKANTDAAATADGEASTSGGTATIGAAVAINLAKVKNMADLGPGSTVDSTDLTLSAIMNAAGSPSESKHSFSCLRDLGRGRWRHRHRGRLLRTQHRRPLDERDAALEPDPRPANSQLEQ